MTYHDNPSCTDPLRLPKLPGWVTTGLSGGPDPVVFLSGASLAVLDLVLSDPVGHVPVRLLEHRLALKAAVAVSKLEGRLAREEDIRDAFYLTPAGEARGPDGDVLAFWREAVRSDGLADRFGEASGAWVAEADRLAAVRGPLAGCGAVMRAVLTEDDRGERFACAASDHVLARALGWRRALPLTALHLSKPDLRDLRSGAGEGAVARAIVRSIQESVRLSHDLTRRAAALRAAAPKLRSKGSAAAVELFLSDVAVAPSGMLSPVVRGSDVAMTGRAARRFCDRLVSLGVARELTGRATFRLYGIGP